MGVNALWPLLCDEGSLIDRHSLTDESSGDDRGGE